MTGGGAGPLLSALWLNHVGDGAGFPRPVGVPWGRRYGRGPGPDKTQPHHGPP